MKLNIDKCGKGYIIYNLKHDIYFHCDKIIDKKFHYYLYEKNRYVGMLNKESIILNIINI
jgi:hypothetical protein